MKVGDLVQVKKDGLALNVVHKVGKKVGVILTAEQHGPNLQVLVLVGRERFFFVPKYLEVISESG